MGSEYTVPVAPLPTHVAVIMDGNRRWARQRLLPVSVGHAHGARSIRSIVHACSDRGIRHLTLFAFSTENWKRPPDEVSGLMRLLTRYLQKEIADMNANGVRLRIIGDASRFTPHMRKLIVQAQEVTSGNSRINLTVAVNYGGRWDMLQAARAWQDANPGRHINDMDEAALQSHLCLAGVPDPDLLIRTGGEARVSNFMLWQMAYTEFYFTDVLWPDFNARALDGALASFAQRDRRFGTSGAGVDHGLTLPATATRNHIG